MSSCTSIQKKFVKTFSLYDSSVVKITMICFFRFAAPDDFIEVTDDLTTTVNV